MLDLVAAGRPIAQIAADLGISDQTIYGWRKQELIATGQLPGHNRAEQAEADRSQQTHPRARDRGGDPEKGPGTAAGVVRPKRRYASIATMAAEGLPVQTACWLLSVSESGYCNATIESFWGRMQTELLNRKRWRTRTELANAIFEYLEIFHNRQRRHSALGMRTPIEFE